MIKQDLTEKEKKFFWTMIQYYIDHLTPPTREELAKYSKTSPQLVQYYLTIFRKKGWLDKIIK